MHEHLAHVSAESLHQLSINYTPGNCNHCILGKQTHTTFRQLEEEKPQNKLNRIHIDHLRLLIHYR